MKNSFIVYYQYAEHFELLTDEELGRLIRAMLLYDKDGTLPQYEGVLKMAFSFIKTQLDIDKDKFNTICERNRKNIQKRWNTKNTTGKSGIPKNTKNTDNDNDNDNDNDKKSVCNKNAHAKNITCHLGSKYKEESCFYCMKKNLCKNKDSPSFKFAHPNETFSEWNKKLEQRKEEVIKELESMGKTPDIELIDYDWLNEDLDT